jgi:hypothetical protein
MRVQTLLQSLEALLADVPEEARATFLVELGVYEREEGKRTMTYYTVSQVERTRTHIILWNKQPSHDATARDSPRRDARGHDATRYDSTVLDKTGLDRM